MAKNFKTQSFNADKELLEIFDKLKRYRFVKNRFISEAIKIHYNNQVKPFEQNYAKKKSQIPF